MKNKENQQNKTKMSESSDFHSQLSHLASMMEQTIVDDEKRKEEKELEDEKARKLAMQRALATGGKVAVKKESKLNFLVTSPLPIVAVVLLLSMVGFAFLPKFLKQKEAATSRLQRLIEQQEMLAQRAEQMSEGEKRERSYSVLEAAQDISGGKKLVEKSLDQLAKENSPTLNDITAALVKPSEENLEVSWKPDGPSQEENTPIERDENHTSPEEILPLLPEIDELKTIDFDWKEEVQDAAPEVHEIFYFRYVQERIDQIEDGAGDGAASARA